MPDLREGAGRGAVVSTDNHETLTLQINTSGAWRNVFSFNASQRREVFRVVFILGQVLGESARWCFVDGRGKREWLDVQ